MSFDFWRDLAKAKTVEKKALETFQDLTQDYQFIDVSDNKQYYHKGDIKAIAKDGREIMLEIKGDTRIHETGNVFCEEQNFWYETGDFTKGNMYSDYQYYCVVSEQAGKIAVIDFKVLQKHYANANHRFVKIPHNDNDSYGYLFPLKEVKALGGLVALIDLKEGA